MAKKLQNAAELAEQLISRLKTKLNDLQAEVSDIENEQDALGELVHKLEENKEIL